MSLSLSLDLGLVVLSAFAWAGLDAVRKQLSAAIAPMPLLVLLNLCLLPVFGAWWAYAGGSITDLSAYAIYGGTGLGLQIVANVLFLSALRVSPLSLTIPFLGLTPVFATLVGAVLLDERPGPWQLVGVALVVLGALILGSSPSEAEREEGGNFVLLRAFVREPGAQMMTGVALCWSVTMSLDKQALSHAALPIHALIQLSGVLIAALIYLLVSGRLAELRIERDARRTLAGAVVLFGFAFGLQLVVIQSSLVSVVDTVKRAIGLLSAVILGKLLFDEDIGALTLVGVLLIVIGVVLVML